MASPARSGLLVGTGMSKGLFVGVSAVDIGGMNGRRMDRAKLSFPLSWVFAEWVTGAASWALKVQCTLDKSAQLMAVRAYLLI